MLIQLWSMHTGQNGYTPTYRAVKRRCISLDDVTHLFVRDFFFTPYFVLYLFFQGPVAPYIFFNCNTYPESITSLASIPDTLLTTRVEVILLHIPQSPIP
jgi:hypothetical protein